MQNEVALACQRIDELAGDELMETTPIFYLCPKCFEAFEAEPSLHQHAVLHIDTAQLDVESRKPLMDNQGNLRSSAPRWFLEATGMISHRRPASDFDQTARTMS